MSYVIEEPQNARSIRTRHAILEAAWSLFRERGPQATTLAAVAEAAGISRRGLYLHFPSRADLLIATVIHSDQLMGLEESLRPAHEASDAESALREWVRHIVDYHSQIRHLIDAVDRSRATDEDLQVLWETGMRAWRDDCERVVERLDREGRLATSWTAATAIEGMWSLMLGFNRMYPALVEEQGWAPEQFGEFFTRIHLGTFLAD